MPFVHNCICFCMKCKPAKKACVDGGAKGRGGMNGKDPRLFVDFFNQLSLYCFSCFLCEYDAMITHFLSVFHHLKLKMLL